MKKHAVARWDGVRTAWEAEEKSIVARQSRARLTQGRDYEEGGEEGIEGARQNEERVPVLGVQGVPGAKMASLCGRWPEEEGTEAREDDLHPSSKAFLGNEREHRPALLPSGSSRGLEASAAALIIGAMNCSFD